MGEMLSLTELYVDHYFWINTSKIRFSYVQIFRNETNKFERFLITRGITEGNFEDI